MVEVFKTDKKETLYAVTSDKLLMKDDIYREVAAYRKESMMNVTRKLKKLCPGYMIQNKGMIELYYGGTNRKGAKPCVIVRR